MSPWFQRSTNISYRHLKPGGYLELQDLCFPAQCTDPEQTSNSQFIKWETYGMEAGQKAGLNLQAPLTWAENLRKIGFVDIHIKWYNWPIGPWAKNKKNKVLGRYTLANFHEAISAPNALFTRVLGWSIEEVQVLVAGIRNEFKEQKIHMYHPICFCYARKPEDASADVATA
jgi:hypothetical protein